MYFVTVNFKSEQRFFSYQDGWTTRDKAFEFDNIAEAARIFNCVKNVWTCSLVEERVSYNTVTYQEDIYNFVRGLSFYQFDDGDGKFSKLQCVKHVKTQMGCSLLEAKNAVEAEMKNRGY